MEVYKMKETFITYYESPIGLIEITAIEEGITSLNFTDNKKRSPRQSKYLSYCVKQLDEYFNCKRKAFSLFSKILSSFSPASSSDRSKQSSNLL